MIKSSFLRKFAIPVLSLLLIVSLCSLAVACPTCKDSLAQNDANHATLVRGYFWSILFMMSMPFLILAGLGTYMYLLIRRAQAQRDSSSIASQREPLVAVHANQ